MRKLLSLALATTLCTAAAVLPAHTQSRHSHPTTDTPVPTRNGLWWGNKSGLYKEAFLGGYRAGSEQTAGHPTDVNKFAITELQDGVDNFYKDFRNRNILLPAVLTYVEDELRGIDDTVLHTELLALRAAAAPPAGD